ncbi:MAG: RIP metalloprotease RseP, partial [Myxococcaceae bacterium]
MPALQSLVLFIVLLGVLITVHELGHFLIAKWLNVKVLRFSVGFGPKIFGFTRGETEYRVAWIPLGGYVKMAGELPGDEVTPDDAARGFLAQPPWKRALIVIGGPLFNLVFPILLYFFVFFGTHEAVAPRIGHVQPELPAAMAGIEAGDKVLSVDGQPVQTFRELIDLLDERRDKETTLVIDRDGQQLTKTLTPASTFQSAVLDSRLRGNIGIMESSPPPLVGVPDGSAAANAGLKSFDRIVAINGQPVPNLAALSRELEKSGPRVDVKVVRLENLGYPGLALNNPKTLWFTLDRQEGQGLAALGVERADLYVNWVAQDGPAAKAGLKAGDRLVAADGKAFSSFEHFQQAIGRAKDNPIKLTWNSEGQTKTAEIKRGKFTAVDPLGGKILQEGVGVAASRGFGPVEKLDIETVQVEVGPWQALKLAAAKVPDDIVMVMRTIGGLLSADIPFDQVTGPVGMYSLAGKAAELGLDSFLLLMGIISVNLGVMNLLPIPVLDGFALLSAIWEAIRRRPIPMRVREFANMVGLAMLV